MWDKESDHTVRAENAFPAILRPDEFGQLRQIRPLRIASRGTKTDAKT